MTDQADIVARVMRALEPHVWDRKSPPAVLAAARAAIAAMPKQIAELERLRAICVKNDATFADMAALYQEQFDRQKANYQAGFAAGIEAAAKVAEVAARVTYDHDAHIEFIMVTKTIRALPVPQEPTPAANHRLAYPILG